MAILDKKIFESTYVPGGCIYMPHSLGSGNQVPKVCFYAILGQKKNSKFLPQNPKGKWPYRGFSGIWTVLAITIDLEVLGRC